MEHKRLTQDGGYLGFNRWPKIAVTSIQQLTQDGGYLDSTADPRWRLFGFNSWPKMAVNWIQKLTQDGGYFDSTADPRWRLLPAWCCILTQSLFISAKLRRTNSILSSMFPGSCPSCKNTDYSHSVPVWAQWSGDHKNSARTTVIASSKYVPYYRYPWITSNIIICQDFTVPTPK